LLVSASCEVQPAPARGQILLLVDTDLPVVGQLSSRPDLSAAAAVDTVRIEVTTLDGSLVDAIDVVAPDPQDWPVSFGIVSGEQRAVRVRLRLFQGALAVRSEQRGRDVLEPETPITVDRIVELDLPEEGVRQLSVLLAGDCIGHASAGAHTCVDGARVEGSPRDGVDAVEALRSSRVGSWAPAVSSPCAQPDREDRVCIEGGYALLGDHRRDGYVDGVDIQVGPTPVHPVRISAFYMDRTEVTVARFDALLTTGAVVDPLPVAYPGRSFDERMCNWGYGDDRMPLNCVSVETARQVCGALQGDLPTEAQWELAARGRGLGRPYPWGDAEPTCCATGVARLGGPTCGDAGPRPVGSFVGADGCLQGDVTRDGVLDMAGNVREWVFDREAGHSKSPKRAIRGGMFSDRATHLRAARRTYGDVSVSDLGIGFRCAK